MKLFELYAELGLDASKFDSGVNKASKQGKSLANSVTSGLQTVSAKTIAMGHALYDFAKTAASTAGNLVKNVVTSFAEYEQLEGGVNKIFGDSAGDVISNAQKAYTTAGLSMNEYMQTVTSFSASLISSLKGDTVAAAKVADMAVQDMSDNANTFGTDMASIQNAYQGFAKQNYSMLDNLKLGYGGSRSEMQRLLKDAQKIKRAQGENVRYSINNLDDVYEAIHVIQEDMGITGTTANEAAQTISGSFNATMAAWSNILTGLGTEQEMDELIGNFVDSGSNLVRNVMQLVPRVGKKVFQEAVPVISGYLSDLGGKALDAGANLMANVLTGLTGDTTSPEEIKALVGGVWTDVQSGIDGLVSAGGGLLKGIYEGLSADSENRGNIVSFFSTLWSDVKANAEDVFNGLSGLYEKFTGKDATAENVGRTAAQAATGYMTVRLAKWRGLLAIPGMLDDVLTTAMDDTLAVDEKAEEIVLAVAETTGTWAAETLRGYAKMVGAAVGIDNPEEWIKRAGGMDMLEAWENDVQRGTEYTKEHGYYEDYDIVDGKLVARSNEYDQADIESLYNKAYEMWFDPESYGITEDQADNWMDALEKHQLGMEEMTTVELRQIADEINAAFTESGIEELAASAAEAANAAQQAADAAAAAAAALSGATVEMDGQTVGALILPTVANGLSRLTRVAGMTVPRAAGLSLP